MKAQSINNRFKLLIGLVTLCGLITATGHTAYAYLNTVSPDPGNTSGSNLAHLVANASYIHVAQTQLVIYAASPTIGVSISGADMCDQQDSTHPIVDGMVDNAGTKLATKIPLGGAVTHYSVSGQQAPADGVRKDVASCKVGGVQRINPGDSTSVTLAPTSRLILASSSTTKDTTLGTLYEYNFTATYTANDCNSDASGNCAVNYFIVTALNRSGNNFTSGTMMVSQASSASGGDARNNAVGGYGNTLFSGYSVEFGGDCSLGATTPSESIQVFDDDNVSSDGAQDSSKPVAFRLRTRPKDPALWTVLNGYTTGSDAGFTQVSAGSVAENPGGGTAGILQRNKVTDDNWLQAGTTGSQHYMNLTFKAAANTEYRLEVRSIDPNNNLQFSYPFDSVDSYVNCDGDNIIPADETTTVVPGIGGGVNADGQSATFNQYATVQYFPYRTGQGGYNELAIQNANHDKYTLAGEYTASDKIIDTASITKQCSDLSYGNCNGLFHCGGGNYGDCTATTPKNGNTPAHYHGGYYWQCAYAGVATKYTGPSDNAPECNIHAYQCKHGTGAGPSVPYNGPAAYLDFGGKENSPGCNNKYVCSATNFDDSDDNVYIDSDYTSTDCAHVFSCGFYLDADHHDPQHFGGTANGYNIADAKTRCDYRCNGGNGSADATTGYGHAPLATNPPSDGHWGTGDKKCYIQPAFYVRCAWDNGSATQFQLVTKDNYGGDFCQGDPNTTLNKGASSIDR